ncbi:MAG TPA: DUF99 family protein [Nitrososphaerales archaeon]|nr:DUF99 family protein [Nitrososphaerales archaeon]
MVLHTGKKAIRALGVAESFHPAAKKSTLAGVVVRTDLVVDGFVFGAATVGGDDATGAVLRMYRRLKRGDVNLIMLAGCIISRYNIIDVDEVARRSGLPVVCLTYNESSGLEGAIRSHFERPDERIESYRKLGARSPVLLRTGHRLYVRSAGISERDTKSVLDAFTLQGGVPEPVRLARLLARSAPLRQPVV